MGLFIASCTATCVSLASSICVARNSWFLFLVLQVVCGVAWVVVESMIMFQVEHWWGVMPCLIPAVGQIVGGVAGILKYEGKSHARSTL